MKQLFLAATAVFGVVPGLAIIGKGIGAPPEMNFLFGGVVEAFGALALIILWVNKDKIVKLPTVKVTRWAVALGLLCFIFIVVYVIIYSYCVVKHEDSGTAYYPLWMTGDIAKMVEKAGSRQAAIDDYGIDAVKEKINKMSPFALSITSTVLLLIYQSVFTSLTIAFGLLGFHKKKSLMEQEPT